MLRYRIRAYFSRRRGALALCWLLALLLAAGLAVSAFNRLLGDILRSYMDVRAQAIVSAAVNTTVIELLSDKPAAYAGLVTLHRDDAGAITAVDTDTMRVNQLKALVSAGVLEKLEQTESRRLGVPLGTLLGGNLFLGRGPAITVQMMPVGSANAVLSSEFIVAGINQTLHRMVLEVQVALTVIMPGSAVMIEKAQQVVLGETVIIGQVPESYTYIDDTRSQQLDKVIDYR